MMDRCVTTKVRSRTTDGLILKIAKNVKFGEIDHYGACPSVYKPFKHSILCFISLLNGVKFDISLQKFHRSSVENGVSSKC